MGESLMREVRNFLALVEDFGQLSGGQMASKHGADPFQGYEWLAAKGRALDKRLAAALRPATPMETPDGE